MAGITDLPFRRIVARFGAGLVVSEMIASQELVQSRPETRVRAELGLHEVATAVQLAGREAYWMAEAARMVEANGARIIDINMGCPAKKVVGGLSGSALLRDLDHALTLIAAVVGAVKVPVTLKTRLGWDDALHNAPLLARRAEAAGVAMITIHGRTRCQFYSGAADWAAIRAVRDAVAIPVIANGDVVDVASARGAISASGAAGVMVGRAARGQPWVLADIAGKLAGTAVPAPPLGTARGELVAEHYQAMLSFYGADLGRRVARKHLGWYLDRVASPPSLRRTILTTDSPAVVLRTLPAAFDGLAADVGQELAA